MAASLGVGSVAFSLVKFALRDLSPLTLAAGRVLFSALAFILVVLIQPWRRRPIARQDRWAVLACGLGGSAGFHILFAWGQQRVSVAVSAVVLACMPAVVAAGEVAFLRHRLTPAQLVGLALSLGGVALMSWGPGAAAVSLAGLAAISGATVVWAGVTVVTRSLADRYDPWWLNTPGTVLGAVVMLALTAGRLTELGRLSASGWAVVAWLGMVSSAFIYAAMARVMQTFSATTTASLGTLVTPLSVVVARVGLGEQPSRDAVIGGAVVVLGVLLVTSRPAWPTRRPGEPGSPTLSTPSSPSSP